MEAEWPDSLADASLLVFSRLDPAREGRFSPQASDKALSSSPGLTGSKAERHCFDYGLMAMHKVLEPCASLSPRSECRLARVAALSRQIGARRDAEATAYCTPFEKRGLGGLPGQTYGVRPVGLWGWTSFGRRTRVTRLGARGVGVSPVDSRQSCS